MPNQDFENDLFISYAHIDNEPLFEGDKGWVTSLHRALEVRVAQLLGKKPKIWRDPKLQGNDAFADRLVQELPQVAALLCILSPRYSNSEWCRRELRTFVQSAGEGIRLGNQSRVFKVVKTPIPFEQHPEKMRDLLGYEFFKIDPDTGKAEELDPAFGTEQLREYWAKVNDLAHDISQLLESLEGRAPDSQADPAPQGAAKAAVYLAESSLDLKEEREALKRDLQRRGYRVLPDRALPMLASDIETMVREQLSQCILSIHLVGRNYGYVPEEARESIVSLQASLAAERAGDDFSRIVWIAPDVRAGDERQQGFIEQLRTDPAIRKHTDLLETPFEELKGQVIGLLEPEEKEVVSDEAEGDEEFATVYLICDRDDLEQVAPLEDYLFDKQGFEVVLPAFEGDEAEVRLDHQENLCSCDAVLIYYGAGNELWLRGKLRELKKAPGYGRSKPMRSKAIFVAPPMNPRKQRLRTREALVIGPSEDFNPDLLLPFITEIRKSEGG